MDYTVKTILKLLLSLLIIAALGWLFYQISMLITILVISALFAYVLDPLATHLEYRGLNRFQATALIFLVLSVVIVSFATIYLPPMIVDLMAFQQRFGDSEATAGLFNGIEKFIKDTVPFLQNQELNLQTRAQEIIGSASDSVYAAAADALSWVATAVIMPFAVFFLLKDGRKLQKNLISLVPNRHFEMILSLNQKLNDQLGGYLRGQFLESSIVGLLSAIALTILDVPYAVFIGIFAGLLNMIPYVGPFSGGSLAILVVLLHGGSAELIVSVIIAFAIIQFIDNMILQPLVIAKSVDLHPLLVIIAVLIGGQFFGILGMLLAVPVTGMIKVITLEIYHTILKYQNL